MQSFRLLPVSTSRHTVVDFPCPCLTVPAISIWSENPAGKSHRNPVTNHDRPIHVHTVKTGIVIPAIGVDNGPNGPRARVMNQTVQIGWVIRIERGRQVRARNNFGFSFGFGFDLPAHFFLLNLHFHEKLLPAFFSDLLSFSSSVFASGFKGGSFSYSSNSSPEESEQSSSINCSEGNITSFLHCKNVDKRLGKLRLLLPKNPEQFTRLPQDYRDEAQEQKVRNPELPDPILSAARVVLCESHGIRKRVNIPRYKAHHAPQSGRSLLHERAVTTPRRGADEAWVSTKIVSSQMSRPSTSVIVRISATSSVPSPPASNLSTYKKTSGGFFLMNLLTE
ncbi:COP9 signalosome subunit 6B [Striga asiatica]|uniref:COP9 signalosome subunit 6B n=1 Tax=Striga asiatica TaxID=4170 RepID=A0A5A7QYY7_STRAF|nr:COP9 signalosome subunit 6B [Striga asiatica]